MEALLFQLKKGSLHFRCQKSTGQQVNESTRRNLDWGLECVGVGIKKRLTVSRLPILINLKSNTMKNTLQRYIGFYKQQEVDALFLHNLAYFNKNKACFCTLCLLLVEKSPPSVPQTAPSDLPPHHSIASWLVEPWAS